MALPSNLRADYVELINAELDSIPIEQLDDVNLVIQGLRTIQNLEIDSHTNSAIADRIQSIRVYLESPEMYVQDKVNYEEFRSIILERIEAKIRELNALSLLEREDYIRVQQTRKNQAINNHKIMSERSAPEPGSEAHVLTEEEWLAESPSLPLHWSL